MRLEGGFIASVGNWVDPTQPSSDTLTNDALPCALERHLVIDDIYFIVLL